MSVENFLLRRILVFFSKKVLIISGIVAVVLAGVLGFGFAFAFSHVNQDQASTPSVTSTTVAPVTSVTTGQRACVLGVVQSLNSQSFVVSANQGKRILTVTVNDQTAYAKHASHASFSFVNLAIGDKVRVTAQGQCSNRKDTTVLAQSVVVLTSTGNPGAIPTTSPTP
jgi:hypothetical protein